MLALISMQEIAQFAKQESMRSVRALLLFPGCAQRRHVTAQTLHFPRQKLLRALRHVRDGTPARRALRASRQKCTGAVGVQ